MFYYHTFWSDLDRLPKQGSSLCTNVLQDSFEALAFALDSPLQEIFINTITSGAFRTKETQREYKRPFLPNQGGSIPRTV